MSLSIKRSMPNKHFTFVFGPNFRSKNGCVTCKLKRRKCDEGFPACAYCSSRNLECEYRKPKSTPDDDKGAEALKESVVVSDEPIGTSPVADASSSSVVAANSPKSVVARSTGKLVPFDIPAEGFQIESSVLDANETGEPVASPYIAQPSSFASLYLDTKGLQHLDYFQHKVSGQLAISFDSMNYFKKLYCLLANNEETFTYLVAGWGALYRKNLVYDEEVAQYLNRSITQFRRLFNDKSNGFDYYFQMCFYLIISELHVCRGDLKEWRVYFEKTCELIEEYGGLEKLCDDFGHSHDIRFMISNLQYNDIMASRSLIEGTRIPVSQYDRAFHHPNFSKKQISYGVDTLQGCHQRTLLLLGDIMSHKVEISKHLQELESTVDKTGSEYTAKRKEYYSYVDSVANALWAKIETTGPNHTLLATLKSEEEYAVYYKAYWLYTVCCKIYWFLYIKQVTPANYQIRALLLEAFELIDFLMSTKMSVILCYPLLICGLCCFEEPDKEFVRTRISTTKMLSPVNNLGKCKMVLDRVWELNQHGNIIVDWSCICEELDWELNLS